MMVRKTILAAGSMALLGLATLAIAQQSNAPPATQPTTKKMSMSDMMNQSLRNCQATNQSIDDTVKIIEEAQSSNDPAKMKDALEQARKQLTGMKEHMSTCIGMMKMMQKMNGGIMGGMKEGMMKQDEGKK